MKSKYQKQAEALERNAAYAKLTTSQKLATLPSQGAKRQRKRLEAVLAKEGAK